MPGVGVTAVPDLTEPVGVWRVWHLADPDHGLRLLSPLRPVVWPPRQPMKAVCRRGHAPPARTCRCGLYGMSGLPRLLEESGGHFRVLGCTALWGRVVEHQEGFRGEFGYPLLLFLSSTDGLAGVPPERVARELEEHYGVPVVVLPEAASRAPDEDHARAVRDEAVRGLAGRRAGDHAAHARLAAAVEDFVGRRW